MPLALAGGLLLAHPSVQRDSPAQITACRVRADERSLHVAMTLRRTVSREIRAASVMVSVFDRNDRFIVDAGMRLRSPALEPHLISYAASLTPPQFVRAAGARCDVTFVLFADGSTWVRPASARPMTLEGS